MLQIGPLTPKRLKSDDGVDAIYPYYAGFSFRFAQHALRSMNLSRSASVLDPWNGSGTTTTAAAQLGLAGYGVDLNPFAGVIASAKLATFAQFKRAEGLLSEACREAAKPASFRMDGADPLREWLPPAAANYVRRLVTSVGLNRGKPSPDNALLVLALARALRPLATAPTKNPTWNVPSKQRLERRGLAKLFAAEVSAIANQLPMVKAPLVEVITGDARDLPLEDRSIDAILTSPPYFTRIDYATKTSFELALLGVDASTGLRCALMGTTALRPDQPTLIPRDWPRALRTLLARIRDHESHRSEGYYFPNALQYFHDAAAALREIARVLRTGGTAMLVLQDSYYKQVHVDLPHLFSVLSRPAGFRADIVARESVGRVMTSVNTASRTYLPERIYTESVLRLTKG